MKLKTLVIGIVAFVAIVLAVVLWPREVPDVPPQRTGEVAQPKVAGDVGVSFVAGVVVDVAGRPVPGATVTVGERTALTGEDGRFSIPDVTPGVVEIGAAADGFIAEGPLAPRTEARVQPGTSLDEVTLVLRKYGTIAGTVTAAGVPVEARLSVLGAGDAFAIDGIGRSAADGTFTLENVPPGRVRLLVESDDYATTESREVSLQDGERVIDVDIDLAPAGVLAGNVIDTEGAPVEGAEVYATGGAAPRSRLVRTTPTGGFRFDNFPVGDGARLRVVAPGFTESVIEDIAVAPESVEVVEVILEPIQGIVGRVVDSDGPVGGAFVVRPGVRVPPVRSGPDGEFAIEGADAATLVAVSPRHASSDEVVADGSEPVELALGPGGMIEGRVVGTGAEAVQEFEIGVEAFEVDGPAPYRARQIGVEQFLSSDGSFAFGPLRPGRYWLRASAGGRAPGSSERIEVTSGDTTAGVEIALGTGGTVRGVVRNAAGEAVSGAMVQLFDPRSPFQPPTGRTEVDGTFALRGVPPGRRSLRVSKRGYLTAVVSGIDVPAGGEASRDVALDVQSGGGKFQFHGIGAVLRKTDGAVEIQSVMDGRPAATFGLAEGDRIIAVDGEATSDMRLDNVVELIRGEEGAAVQLEVEREGEGLFTVEVERGRVVVR